MRYRTAAHSILALLIALSMASCNGETGNDGGPPPGENTPDPDLGPPPPNLVTYKNAGESAEADFTGGSEEYLVVPYSVSSTAASAISFEIKLQKSVAADGGVSSSHFKLSPPPLRVRDPKLWARWQQRLAVERWTRSLAEKAAKAKMSAPWAKMNKKLAACTVSADCSATEVCHEGQCATSVTIKTETFSTTAQTIDAQVKKKGQLAAILVDSADTVPQANIDAMLEKFENLLYKRDVALFGNPPLKSGEATLSSDRNADGLVWLVFTSKVQEKGAVGFFVATDFDDTDAKSNKADILYLDSGLTKLESAYATIAHEFQHLLGFAVKVYKSKVNGGNGSLEALWLDEGQSHFAEDACGFGGENVTILRQDVFSSFSETAMVSSEDGQAMRGMAFTFVRYLFEQKGGVTYGSDGSITDSGGAAMLAKLHTTDQPGVPAVEAAYGPFKEAFDGWIAAVALDGRGVTTFAKYVFKDLVDDPVTGNQIGLKIRGPRKDATGAVVTLEGPLEEDLTADVSDTIPNATGKLFLLKGQSGKVNVSVTSQEQDFRFALIKLK